MNAREQWLQERRSGIGGSDAAAVFNLSPYSTAIELYHEKRGELPLDSLEPEWFRWGRLLEPVVRQEYAERTGRVVQQVPGIVRHPKYEWMLATLDGHVDDDRIYEGKTARSSDGWGEPSTDQVPEHILFQTHHYLCVTQRHVADVAVLIGGSDFRIYTIESDPEFNEMLIEGEHSFWQSVLSGFAPDPAFTEESARVMLRKLFPGTNGKTLEADERMLHWRAVYDEATEAAKVYTTAAEAAKAHMLYAMKDAAQLAFPDGRCLRRKLVKKKPYTVEATEYIDARFANMKE